MRSPRFADLDPRAVQAEAGLLAIRKVIAPERDVAASLVRGDIRELREAGRRAYFQDLYDHIVRVTDEVDTFRDLVSNVVDAHLAAQSNRLNEVIEGLTSVATCCLILVWPPALRPELKSFPYDDPVSSGSRQWHTWRRSGRGLLQATAAALNRSASRVRLRGEMRIYDVRDEVAECVHFIGHATMWS